MHFKMFEHLNLFINTDSVNISVINWQFVWPVFTVAHKELLPQQTSLSQILVFLSLSLFWLCRDL